MPIDYSRWIRQSWEIFSRHHVLWALALFVVLPTTAVGLGSAFAAALLFPAIVSSTTSGPPFTGGDIDPGALVAALWAQWAGAFLGLDCVTGVLLFASSFF